MTKQNEQITLAPVPQEELAIFKTECQEAFMKGLQDVFQRRKIRQKWVQSRLMKIMSNLRGLEVTLKNVLP